MRVLLRFFTGTGNTRLCASFLAKAFQNAGHEADLVEQNVPVDVSAYDLIGFGYPIHAFNAPKTFVNQIKALPKAEKDYFFFKVSGEPFPINNSSSVTLARILKRKGYRKVGEKHFLMPYNIIFRYKDPVMKQMYLYLPALCQAFVEDLLSGKAETIRYGLSRIMTFLFKIEWIAPFCNAPLVSFRPKKCTRCMKCLKNCPEQAIYLNKKDKLKIHPTKCAMCMRCTLNCPVDAIRFGIMNPWKVNGDYGYAKLEENDSVNPDYINANTKGYFKLFNKYFDRQRALLKAHNIPDPIETHLSK